MSRKILFLAVILFAVVLFVYDLTIGKRTGPVTVNKNILVTVRMNMVRFNYDSGIMELTINNESGAPVRLGRIRMETADREFSARIITDSDSDGKITSADKTIGTFSEKPPREIWEALINTDAKTLFIKSDNNSLKPISLSFRFTDAIGSVLQDAYVYTRYIDEQTSRYRDATVFSPAEFISLYPQFAPVPGEPEAISVGPGTITFAGTVIIPKNVKRLVIVPGSTLNFAPEASLISYAPVEALGTADKPILFSPSGQQPWGVFGIMENYDRQSYLKYVTVRGASDARINGAYLSGGLAVYYSDISIDKSLFTDNSFGSGDDGVNIKSSRVDIANSRFINNHGDGLDLDNVSGTVHGNLFESNGNDGLDVSFNQALIENNVSKSNGDKCISIGEQSLAAVKNNLIAECPIGIAVKESRIDINGNIFQKNTKALALYRKKFFFEEPKVLLSGNTFKENKEDILKEESSEVLTNE